MSVKHCISRFDKLKIKRALWDDMFQEIGEYVYPTLTNFTQTDTAGQKPSRNVYDNTAIHANQLLASGLHSMLTNPATKWFTMRFVNSELNDKRDLRLWLDTIVGIMFDKINSSKATFNTAMHEVYLQHSAFGTSSIFIGENVERNGLSFSARSLNEIYIAENADGLIDTVFRKFTLTVRQMIQLWGKDSLSEKSKQALEKNQFDKEFDILHAIHPREDMNQAKKDSKNLPFISMYVEIDSKHLLNESGFNEMPIVTGRFYKSAGEVYGRGPGISALADIKMLNQMLRTILTAGQKIVDPPMYLNLDGHVGTVNLFPNGVNWFREGTSPPFTFKTDGNIPIGIELVERSSAKIREMFFVDQLQLQESPRMTATEVLQRTEEKLRLMGPMLGRLQSEILGPMIDRIFGICFRAGWFPVPPADIGDEELKVEYTSPLANAQRQMEAQGALRTIDVMSFFIESDPSILDNFDGDTAFRTIGEIFNVPTKFFKASDEVEKIRASRKEAQDAQQATELLKTGGAGIKNLASAGASMSGENQ